jgi:hypothetical protein
MKKCPTSLAIKETQIKTNLRFHLTPVKMSVIKKQQVLARMRGEKNPHKLLVGK